MTRFGGFGIFDKFHCEKISALVVASIFVVLYLAYLGFVTGDFQTVNLFFIDEPITLLWLSMLILVGAYFGVIGYRITNRKPLLSIDTLKFWDADA